MSHKLAKILAKSEAEVTALIDKLEEQAGYPSEDVRLLAENQAKIRHKIVQLGLDPDDTTDAEMYHALQARFSNDSKILDRAVGVNAATSVDERFSKAVQLVNHCAQIDNIWAIKKNALKKILTANPPKHLAKKLHYRSVSSMLKREHLAELFLAANVLESGSWRKANAKQISNLTSSDYEIRPVEIVFFPANKWKETSLSSIQTDKIVGAIGVWSLPEFKQTSILGLTLRLLNSLYQVNPTGYVESLQELSPALRWWADCQYLVSDGDTPVSFNLKDVALNYQQGRHLEAAVNKHVAHSLWQELTDRYQALTGGLSDELEDKADYRSPVANLPTGQELAEELISLE